jgi:hypothetical protein
MNTPAAASVLFALMVFWLPAAPPPRDAIAPNSGETPPNFRLHVELRRPAKLAVRLDADTALTLPEAIEHDVAVERPPRGMPVVRVWSDGMLTRGPEEIAALATTGAADFPDERLDLGREFTIVVRFTTTGGGTLVAKAPAQGKWAPDAKALFIRGGHLVYDIGWLGAISGGPRVDDGKPHAAVIGHRDGLTHVWLDGKKIAERKGFTRPDGRGHILKVGRAAPDFAGDFQGGMIGSVRGWARALANEEITRLFKNDGWEANTPDFAYSAPDQNASPAIEPNPDVEIRHLWLQPLERTDHANIVKSWNPETLKQGAQLYANLCVVCHGTKDVPGSLPTATAFATGELRNGADPYSMFHTLTHGYGQMVAQPQYTTAQKYAVIQYIREEFLRPDNPQQYVELTDGYIKGLPKGLAVADREQEDQSLPPYRKMDLGPALFWTYAIEPENSARKGLAIRLDDGPGGVSNSRALVVFDHDTLRVATATTGGFLDWKDIAFDGSHGTTPQLTGEAQLTNPSGPGWASPEGRWDDPRPVGKDGLPYGPLPRDWARFVGLYRHGNQQVIASEVGGTRVLESHGWIDYGAAPVFTRTFNLGHRAKPLYARIAPDSLSVAIAGQGKLLKQGGFWIAELPGDARARVFISRGEPPSLAALAEASDAPLDLETLTHGGPAIWATQPITTTSSRSAESGAFAIDDFPLPIENPWHSWMRPGGFDFTPDGKGAIVAMWNGDVWRVDGVMKAPPAELRWHRIASGLFQPLGVKFRGDDLFITCRDQIACLRDLNDDGEIDFIECFNNDHQVTEHFHEFAMGLQVDDEGNFYYAKSGRHALDSVVPHHGTLLKVLKDGSATQILATGFRAANGVCLNPDGSFFITDQEGFWTPKNRINRVRSGGFYGNMFGYTNIVDPADAAMEPPMIWVTNAKDRSPAEMVWVPSDTWGALGGSLLNLSYGTGRIFIVPHEALDDDWQGAVCELPIPAFATGIMRGRFGLDGALYTAGMFAWAGNATSPGGFHRITHLGGASHLPRTIKATHGKLEIVFSDPLDPEGISLDQCKMATWSLRRTANYGSSHYDDRALEISGARIARDGRTLTLDIPKLEPTHCYELKLNLRGADGTEIERNLHGTIHRLGATSS